MGPASKLAKRKEGQSCKKAVPPSRARGHCPLKAAQLLSKESNPDNLKAA